MAEIKQFKVISTFSGCGGSSLGYQLAGGKVLLAVECDSNAVETYKANFPDTQVYHGDIAKLSIDEIFKRTGIKEGELDIFDGSPPCQGFSTAGKKNLEDNRNQLFKEYVRILRGLKPKAFVMENVSGMVKGKMRLIFADILKELKDSGYNVKARLLNAMYFNVPQSRQRMIFIGIRKDLNIEPSHPEPKSFPISSRMALIGVEDGGKKLSDKINCYWNRLKPGESISKYHPKGHYFGHIKLNPNKPAPTLIRSSGSAIIHYSYPRYINNNERSRLTSFPDTFKWIGSYQDVCDRIGNCVPPNFMKAIAEHIRDNILNKL